MRKIIAILVCGTLMLWSAGASNNSDSEKVFSFRFDMKGVLLSLDQPVGAEWPEQAYDNGINTIGVCGNLEQMTKFVSSEQGVRFLKKCKVCNVDVEYHLQEVASAADCCVRSRADMKRVVTKALSALIQFSPSNHRYYWGFDISGFTCKCTKCSKYTQSEKMLLLENALLKELRKVDPLAMLAHVTDVLSCGNVKPEPGMFAVYTGDVDALKDKAGDLFSKDVVVHAVMSEPSQLESIAGCGIRNVTSCASCATKEILFEYGRGLNMVKIESMTHPWGDIFQETETTVALIGDNLHLRFDAVDGEIIYDETFEYERDMEIGDRIEAYFSKDRELTGYYGFEVDPVGNVMAYKCKYFKQFEYEWDAPQGFWAKGHIKERGYVVDVSIPMEFINTMVIDGKIYIGLYRADYRRVGDEVVRDSYSWKDPGNGIHTFHQPEIFYHVTLF